MAREIPLTRGKVAIVDDVDFHWLSHFKWLAKDGRYAARHNPGGKGFIYMHHEVLGDVPEGMVPDHINGNTFDNRGSNLRICTRAENLRNKRRSKNASLGFKGIRRSSRRFLAHIMVGGRRFYSRSFATAEEAAREYDRMARLHHGEFACLNFPAEVASEQPFRSAA